jgi:LysR family transcriptional regulator, regulator for metE and metH
MGTTLELKHLQLVVAIAEEGTLTRAGKRLHLTQSALSHQLATLETRLGVELFQRSGRCLRPTVLGQRLIARARRLVTEVDALEAELAAPRLPRSELRLVTQCFTCYHWLPTVLASFEAQNPDVAVSLVLESTRNALDALDADAVDVAITTELCEDARYEHRFVFEDELMVALPSNHALLSQSCVTYADLRNDRLLLHPPSDADKRWFSQAMQCHELAERPRQVQHVPVTDAIVELVANGYGCALLTRLSANHAAVQGRIALRSFAPRPLKRRFRAYCRGDNPKQLPIVEFIEAVFRYCNNREELRTAE